MRLKRAKMKFVANNLTKCLPRIGKITDVPRIPDFQLETPAALLYTRGGSIPHVTREVFELITNEPQGIQIPLASTATFREPLSGTEHTLGEFVGLQECLVYVTVQDPGDITPGGHHLQNNVPIWTRSGKLYVNSNSYMDTIEAFKPDLYCVLSDSDTNVASAKKRIAKSVDQTLSFVGKCLERHTNSKHLQHSTIVAAVEGGYCLKARDRCLKTLLDHNDRFGAYLINGLHNNGPEMEFLPFTEVQPVVEHVVNQIPEDKVRIVEGCWNPVNVIKLVRLGVDLFDTSYVHVLVERKSALTFSLNNNAQEFEINLADTKFSEDFSPLMKECSCLTCTKYTRAYIHHLFTVSELLSPILLTIHNTHHYLEFFKAIRQAVANNTLNTLEKLVQEQFDRHNKPSNETVLEKEQIN